MFCHNCGTQLSTSACFCNNCGTQKRSEQSTFPRFVDEKEAITHYFRRGYRYETIILFLEQYHGISLSLRTLKRRLKEYKLDKNCHSVMEDTIRQIIKDEIQGPSSLLGYRRMWNKLRTSYNITVPRDTVMKILKELDPTASALRKARKLQRRAYVSPGPNAAWHVDGYDKLKPYGLPIHGCIDGYSRRIIWLKICRSNNNPIIPASFYLHCVEELGLCPLLVQTDCGTENGILAGLQCKFAESENAHRYSSSPNNQRIENWWSHNKKGFTAWVIDFFKALVSDGKLALGNHLQMECVWFVFSNFLQSELDKVKQEWNTHYIRKSRHNTESGVPDELFFLPQTRSSTNCGINVSKDDIQNIVAERDIYAEADLAENAVDSEMDGYFRYVVKEENLQHPPGNWSQARELYEKIIELSGS